MNLSVGTFATNTTRNQQNAKHAMRLLLLCTVTVAAVAALYFFIGGSAPEYPISHTTSASTQSPPRTTAQVREAYGQLPLSFEANQGQADESFNFLARGAGYTISLSPTAAIFALAHQSDDQSHSGRPSQSARDNRDASARAKQDTDTDSALHSQRPQRLLRMNLLGADRGAGVEGLNELEGRVNYFTDKDQAKWRTNIRTFERVRYDEVYPGIDLVYYGNQRQLEYDFVVAPGKDVRAIALRFEGADKVEVDASGDLLLRLGESVIRQPKPFVYQEVAGARHPIEGRYLVESDGRVGFEIGEYDDALPLVIDPTLVYSTYLGGSDTDEGTDIAVDSAGNAYICGNTSSTNFPTANAFQPTFGGATFAGGRDAFVTKINAAGTALVYSTYLGGGGDDRCGHLTLDAAGNAYIAGETTSTNFPTANAFQPTFGGGLSDAFVTKINAAGTALIYSTYIGGSIFDAAGGIAIDSSSNVYITGRTTSSNFPTANAIQAAYSGGPGADVFITKINATGTALFYSTYLGGNGGQGFEHGSSIAVDSSGNAYVTGQTSSTNFPTLNAIQNSFGGGTPDGDAFVTKINAAGTALVYSTYLGGSDNDVATDIAVDAAGNAHLSGFTSSTNFPTANAFQNVSGGGGDAFVTKYNATGTGYVYSTYLGGTGSDAANEIALDSAGNAYIAGGTASTNFPVVDAIQSTQGGGGDTFVTKFIPSGTALIYSTYFGGSGFERANSLFVDSANNVYVTGLTSATDFPTLNPLQAANGGGSSDAFVYKLSNAAAVTPPVANNDAYNTAEDTPLTVAAPGVLGNDTTPTGTLRAILVTQPTHGTLTFNSDGSFTYTPASNYNGPDSFTYKANNGTSDSNTATVSITIGAVNDGPVNTVPGAQTLNGSTPLTFSVPNGNAITVSDIDAGPASVRVTLTATNGTLSLSTTFGLVFITGDGTGDATMTFTGALSSINGALNGMTFTPTAGFSGAASVQITTDDLGNTGTGGALSDTDSVAITVSQRSLQFSAVSYTVGEAQGQATITVTRTGDTTAPATVDYETSDPSGLNNCDVNTGNASARCDYTAVGGTLSFAAGESSRTFTVPVINDVYVEGPETLTLTLSNPTGGVLGTPSVAQLSITDDDTTAGAPNPINTRSFFIRQLYLDVLNREPEPSGLAAWLNRLNTCPQPGETLQNCDEIEVASAFFRSPEFFDRVYFIYKVYEEALGRQPQYDEYQRDIRRVTGFLTSQELEARKQQFVLEFTQRQEFRNKYDHITDSGAFVDAVLQTAGVQLDSSTRALLVSQLANSQIQRWDVLRIVANSPEVSQKFFNKAFVVVAYFAFLRRNPDINYLHWINVLNTTGDYREMIRGFIQSSEYRLRFGPI